jgi:hypothetical protein
MTTTRKHATPPRMTYREQIELIAERDRIQGVFTRNLPMLTPEQYWSTTSAIVSA